MEFMDKINEISKKAKEGATQTYKTVVDKSGKLVEEAKLKIVISDKEASIDEIFNVLGQTVYDMYKQGEDVGKIFTKECKKVDKIKIEINKIDKIILFNKGLRKCENCNDIISIESMYCKNCGIKQKVLKIKKEEKNEEKDKEKKEEILERVCPVCGYVTDSKSKFCQRCGYEFK